MALALDTACEKAIRAHAEADYPHECCGALLGVREGGARDGGGATVTRAVRMKNLDTSNGSGRARDRFTLDPLELLAVEKAADRDGLELLGFYHSHPDSKAEPSATDLAFAEPWPGFSWIILSVRGGRSAELTSWVVSERTNTFGEEPVTVASSVASSVAAAESGGGVTSGARAS